MWALFFLGVYIVCVTLQFCEGKFFIYMTNWGYGLATVTMLISAVQVTRWHCDLQGLRSLVHESGQKARTTLGLKIYWWLYNVSLLMALIISTVYWIFLNGRMSKYTFDHMMHKCNLCNFITFLCNCVLRQTDAISGNKHHYACAEYDMFADRFYDRCISVATSAYGTHDVYGNRFFYIHLHISLMWRHR